MFGYISINKAEMKFKDYDMYHSYYCGLCKCLKKCYGIRGQLTLSFDMTFLVVLLTGLYEAETKVETVRCVAHPFEKHPARVNEFTNYAAAMNLVLSYYKCKDDWDDERKKKGYAAAKLLQSRISEIEKEYPEKVQLIASNLKKLSEFEAKNEQNIDLMAGLFGDIMAEIFVYRHDVWEVSLRKMGFFLGKFIYLMDAYEDVEKDIKSGSYNPLKEAFQSNPNFAEDCRELLTLMMAECSREFEKLPILLHADILRNVLYSGVWCHYTTVTSKRNEKQENVHSDTNKSDTGDHIQ